MTRSNLAIAVLWILVGVVVVGAVVYAVAVTSDTMLKLAAAIVGAGALLMAAIVNHSLALLKEQEIEQRKRKQDNYIELVRTIGAYVRDRKATADTFASIHLLSWVFGSPRVIETTAMFMEKPTRAGLQQLLVEMREDVGLPAAPEWVKLPPVFTEVETRPVLPE